MDVLKSRRARVASCHSAFMGNCPTISLTCYYYLPRRWTEMPTFRNQMRVKCLFSFTVSVIRLEVLRECCSLLPPNDWMLWYLKMPWNGNWDPIVHLIMVVNHLWCIILTDQSNFQEKKCKVSKSLFSLKYYLKVSLKFITWNL